MNPALGHASDVARETICQPDRRLEINLKRPQIPRIHPNQVTPRIQSPIQLLTIVHFAKHIEAMRPG
jgi:hypothetical protein